MSLRIVKGVAAACAVAVGSLSLATAPRPTHALLFSADDATLGVGAITTDTDSGLEWLDLTLAV